MNTESEKEFEIKILKKIAEQNQKLGRTLSEELCQRLREIGFKEIVSEIFLEDLLRFIKLKLPYSKALSLRLIWTEKGASVFMEGQLPSETIRADSETLVDAVGKFIIETVERGLVSISADGLFAKGLEVSDYKVRSNLLLERNWILKTFEEMTRRQNKCCRFFQLFKKPMRLAFNYYNLKK